MESSNLIISDDKRFKRVALKSILSADNVDECIRENLDVVLELIPELKFMIGFEHNHPHHHLDVWEHTLLALKLSNNDFDTRLALLLHDIGKPFSFQDEEVRHFRGHPLVSAQIAKEILTRMGYDSDYIIEMCQIIKLHDMPIEEKDIAKDIDFFIKLFKVQASDAMAHNPAKNAKRIAYLHETAQMFEEFACQIEK